MPLKHLVAMWTLIGVGWSKALGVCSLNKEGFVKARMFIWLLFIPKYIIFLNSLK